MDVPPPKPPRSKKREQRINSSPTDSLPSDERDAGSYAEKLLETGEDFEQCLPANGVCSDGMPIEEKEEVPPDDRAEEECIEEVVNVPFEESARIPTDDPENLEFQVGEDTALADINVSDSPIPISNERTVADDDMQSPSAVEQNVLSPAVNPPPESPSITSHDSNHSPDPVSPPHSSHSNAASPAHELPHVDSPQSSHKSSDSVFTQEHTPNDNEPLFQSPEALTTETTQSEPDSRNNAQHESASSPSFPTGCSTAELNTRPTSCPQMSHPASIPLSTSTIESSSTTTPPHAGTKDGQSSHEANDDEQERDFKDKEVKVKTRRIKDDSSWIGRKPNWAGSPSQHTPRPSSDSATHPLSLEGKPATSISSTGTDDFRAAGNSQSSSHGGEECDGNEEDGGLAMRTWRSSDRLPVSVSETQFTRKAVRSRSFNSATLNRIGDQKGSFTASSTVPRSDAESLKEAMKNLGKEKKLKGNGKKWPKASVKIKGALGKVFNPLKKSKTLHVPDSAGPTSPTDHDTGNGHEHEESSEEDEGRDKRFPKLRRVHQPRPVSIISDYNPEYPHLFQYVFLVGVKEDPGRSKTLSTYIIQKFPPQISKEDSKDPAISAVNQFCFPDLEHWKPVSHYESETYSFVLTSVEGNKRFGYCRRLLPEGKGERLPEVYCIISPHGCFDLYSKVLDHVEQRRAVSRVAVFTLLKTLYVNPFPAPGRTASIKVISATSSGDMEVMRLTRPHESRLEHVNFGELCSHLSAKSIVQVFATLLMERRVILSAQRLSTLSSCCHALLALLYPFEWYHTCIPLLPSGLLEICSSPAPFIIGLTPRMVKQLDHLEVEMEEALIVDLDKGKFLKKFGDESVILPRKLYKYLQHELESPDVQSVYKRASLSSKSYAVADEIVVNAFLTVFAYLYGNYKEFLTPDFQTPGQKFQKDDFVRGFTSESEQQFLEEFHKTMMFDMFMHVREDPVTAETISQGHFEMKLSDLKERFPIIEQCGVKKSRFHVTKKVAPSKH